ncbi:twisted gastrulation protein homolog 1-A-like isoform X2 [Coccinella septempunctata]|uniref:twisted gastrulation protein homolog 1-A-like isoform X2 n=1 Tax=Coccinella septempunctata TaxID=41139 RepID=UPI001D05D9CD|nr:twisted gastrulation protein homolog 1-A-like isoform X2 [Coccinella septempunctata]
MWKILAYSLGLTLAISLGYVYTCNEAVCGSVVSKCLLTQSCNCELTNCTCCKDCFNCLSYLFSECCSCVDKCPTNTDQTTKKPNLIESYVEDFLEPVPGLFQALTEKADDQNRWISVTYPIDFEVTEYTPKKLVKIHMKTNEQDVIPKTDILTLNCTVAFMSQCMSNAKCKSTCITMGASKYRWFHDACCECIGERCINYGINESRCKDCPMDNSQDEMTDDEEPDYPDDDEANETGANDEND